MLSALPPSARVPCHVGSTSVPGLAGSGAALDVLLVVEAGADEDSYVPALEALGFRAVLRAPCWRGRRMLLTRPAAPALGAVPVDCHVFWASSPEPARMLALRDWLRCHGDDAALYARSAAAQDGFGRDLRSRAMSTVVERILDRAHRRTVGDPNSMPDVVVRRAVPDGPCGIPGGAHGWSLGDPARGALVQVSPVDQWGPAYAAIAAEFGAPAAMCG